MDISDDEYNSCNSDESVNENLQLECEDNDVYQKLAWVFDCEEDPEYLRYITRFLAGILHFNRGLLMLACNSAIHSR